MYDTEVSPAFISSVTNAVMDEVTAWQTRPLATMYPVVIFDALRVEIREDGVVRNNAVYPALAVLPDGSATYDWKAAMNQFAVIYAERFTDPYR